MLVCIISDRDIPELYFANWVGEELRLDKKIGE